MADPLAHGTMCRWVRARHPGVAVGARYRSGGPGRGPPPRRAGGRVQHTQRQQRHPAGHAAHPEPEPEPRPADRHHRGRRGALPVKDADWVQVADGHVWTTLGTEVAQQLDPESGAELTSVPLGGQVCTAMDQGFDALWVAVCSTPGTVLRINPPPGRCWPASRSPTGSRSWRRGRSPAARGSCGSSPWASSAPW